MFAHLFSHPNYYCIDDVCVCFVVFVVIVVVVVVFRYL